MSTLGGLSATEIKRRGAHYTPPELAKFLANRVAARVESNIPLRILDPACGDGQLLEAIAIELPTAIRCHTTLFGMENSPGALQDAEDRLSSDPTFPRFELLHADFLDW